MLVLETLARQVIENWDSNQLQVAVRALAAHLKELDDCRREYAAHIEQAHRRFACDDLEFDDAPLVSPSVESGGAFVNAWLWIDLTDR